MPGPYTVGFPFSTISFTRSDSTPNATNQAADHNLFKTDLNLCKDEIVAVEAHVYAAHVVGPGISSVVGDGSANDTTAVQAVFTAAAGGTVFVAEGTYMVQGITVPADTAVVCDGGATFKKRANGNLISSVGARSKIVGGTFDVNRAGPFTGEGIVLSGAVDVTIQGCRIINATIGGNAVQASASADRLKVIGCTMVDGSINVADCRATLVDGNHMTGDFGANNPIMVYNNTLGQSPVDGSRIVNNYISHDGASADRAPVTVGNFPGNSTVHPKNIICSNNTIRCNATGLGSAISFAQTNNCIISNNACEIVGGTTTLGLIELAFNTRSVVANNVLIGNALAGGTAGVQVTNSNNCVISDNIITDPTSATRAAGITVYADGQTINGTYTPLSSSRNIIKGNDISLPSGTAACGIHIQCNAATATIDDTIIDGNHVQCAGVNGSGIQIHNDVAGGLIRRITISNNTFTSLDIAFDYGTVAGMYFRNNIVTSVNTRWYNPAGTATDVTLQGNSWQFDTAEPTTQFHFAGEEWIKTNPAGAGIPGGVCVTAGTPGTFKNKGVLAT